MKKELISLRQIMAEQNIDYYIIPTTDFHGSEYVNDYFKCRKFVSGFSGSAGTLVISQDEAFLWADGRYFLQAAAQLKGSGIELMKMGEPGVPMIQEYLESKKTPYVLGFDGRLANATEGRAYESIPGVDVVWNKDLVGMFWSDRPAIVPSEVRALPLDITGKSAEDKMLDVRKAMADKGASCVLFNCLEEISWLFNLRGNDVEDTPVFFSFALVTGQKAQLFVMDSAVSEDIRRGLPFVEFKEFDEIYNELAKLPAGETLWMDEDFANFALRSCVPEGVAVMSEPTPVDLMKAVKNPVEIKGFENSHVKDGVAMARFMYWLDKNVGSGKESEMSAAAYLDQCRYDEGAFELSFPTISGYNSNGAIVHYDPQPDTNAMLKPEGLLLVDSGGQYEGGTTDITRTIALGPLTQKMKDYYTYVLKSHIVLSTAVFDAGTTGLELDALTRKPLRDEGLDFNHGTGHGVGHMLSCHEGPQYIATHHADAPFLPGMVTSDEPGVYIENEFGVRLENLLLSEELPDGRYGFTPLTLCPFDRNAIAVEKLTDDELAWVNDYHSWVRQILTPLLEPEVAEWLAGATAEITR